MVLFGLLCCWTNGWSWSWGWDCRSFWKSCWTLRANGKYAKIESKEKNSCSEREMVNCRFTARLCYRLSKTSTEVLEKLSRPLWLLLVLWLLFHDFAFRWCSNWAHQSHIRSTFRLMKAAARRENDLISFDHLARKSSANGMVSIFGETLQSQLSRWKLEAFKTFLVISDSDSTKSHSSGWRRNRMETAEKIMINHWSRSFVSSSTSNDLQRKLRVRWLNVERTQEDGTGF